MAGDWIKIEHSLPNKPEVMDLARILNVDEMAVVGHLVCFWTWVDQNLSPECPSASGTKRGLDRVAGRDGFVDAMISVGWLVFQDGKVEIPNYDHHLSESAKKRSEESRRKRNQRQKSQKCPADAGTKLGQNTGPEKRREEKRVLDKETREVKVHPEDIHIPANVSSEQCKAQMEYMFRVMNHRRAERGEPNVDDFGMQANWDIASKIGPERLHEVIAMAISREWKALVVPDGVVDKKSNRKSGGFTDDENAEWVRITAACRISGEAGKKARAQFDEITKQIMNSVGGSEAVRKTNPGDFQDNELKTRFFSTKRIKMKLDMQEVR